MQVRRATCLSCVVLQFCFLPFLVCPNWHGDGLVCVTVDSCLDAAVAGLAAAELEKYNLVGWWPTFVTDAGGNVRRALRGAGGSRVGAMADWSRCCCHLLHNAVTFGLHNLVHLRAPTNPGPRRMAEALER
jgi:hypothetical protein